MEDGHTKRTFHHNGKPEKENIKKEDIQDQNGMKRDHKKKDMEKEIEITTKNKNADPINLTDALVKSLPPKHKDFTIPPSTNGLEHGTTRQGLESRRAAVSSDPPGLNFYSCARYA